MFYAGISRNENSLMVKFGATCTVKQLSVMPAYFAIYLTIHFHNIIGRAVCDDSAVMIEVFAVGPVLAGTESVHRARHIVAPKFAELAVYT